MNRCNWCEISLSSDSEPSPVYNSLSAVINRLILNPWWVSKGFENRRQLVIVFLSLWDTLCDKSANGKGHCMVGRDGHVWFTEANVPYNCIGGIPYHRNRRLCYPVCGWNSSQVDLLLIRSFIPTLHYCYNLINIVNLILRWACSLAAMDQLPQLQGINRVQYAALLPYSHYYPRSIKHSYRSKGSSPIYQTFSAQFSELTMINCIFGQKGHIK